MARRKNKSKNSLYLSLLILVFLAIIGTASTGMDSGEAETTKPRTTLSGVTDEAAAMVHFIDIGQGSASLVAVGEKAILIDTGESDYSDTLLDYINACGVTELEYVVASHPHSDHIGGMVDVIENYPIGTFIMPELSEKNTPTTRVYENMLDALIEKEINAVYSEVGDVYTLCEGVSFEILGPCEQLSDLNDMSVIVKLTVHGTDFMVLGDAEKQELSSVYGTYPYSDYKSDVLVMGHHGSSTSIYEDFLNAVNADVAVISCGRNNSYGHPHEEALEYVEEVGLTLYRTDLEGDIIFRCSPDGYERMKSK